MKRFLAISGSFDRFKAVHMLQVFQSI